MISKLNSIEFKNTLKSHTKFGNPQIMGTPLAISEIFNESGKTFFGEFYDSSFKLTENSMLYSVPYIIEGNYKNKNEFEAEVSYEIKPLWFPYLWIRIFPLIVISLINIYFIKEFWDFSIEKGTIIFFIVMNIILSTLFIPIFTKRRKKNKMEKKFMKLLKITSEENNR